MPKISTERLLARERGIVQAAARCLQRKGLEGTGMRDLFRAANLSPGAVYRYFPSKEELIAAVAAAGQTSTDAALAATADVTDPAVRLRHLLEAAAAGLPPARLQCELEAAALHSPRVAAALADRRRAARQELGRALGRPDGGDPPTDLVMATLDSLARHKALDPEADLEARVRLATDLLSRLLSSTGGHDA